MKKPLIIKTILIIFILNVQSLFADYLFEKDLVVIGSNATALKTFFSVKTDSLLIVNELQSNSFFRLDKMIPKKFQKLQGMSGDIFFGASIQSLKPVEGGVVITIEFAGEIGEIFSRTVVLAQSTKFAKVLIDKKHQSQAFQRYFFERYDDFRIVEPAQNIFLANPETFFVTEKKNPELLAGMMVSNLVKNKLNGKHCIYPDGLSIRGIPTEKTIEHVKKIKPKMFGLVGDKKDLDWIVEEKNTKDLDYHFERFFGSWSFDLLKDLEPQDLSNIDMLGYCPQFKEISEKVWSERIDFLKEKFKDTKLLVGPCVDLYGTINQKTNSADFSGFEIKNEKIAKYINGDYDSYIEKTLDKGDEIGVFVTYYQKFINVEEFVNVTEKIMSDGHLFGLTTDPDNYFVYDLLYHNSCRKVAESKSLFE